jgi:FAD:protein FMN transferase
VKRPEIALVLTLALVVVGFVIYRGLRSTPSEATVVSDRDDARRDEPPPDAPPVAPDAGVRGPLVRASRPIMSTVYQISVATDDEEGAHEAIDAALDEVERLGVVLSEWRDDSEVSAINRSAGGEPVHVGSDTLTNVTAALEVAQWTEGAFDITWAALRGYYLFQPGEAHLPDMDAVRERLPLIDWHDVVVDEAASTVGLRREGMAIGLGGIAKGYAVDRAAAILEAAGFHDFMIFGGGQVLVRGLRDGRRWRVGIQHPRGDAYIGFLEVSDCSIATSGDYEHFFIAEDGARWHHIIDLSTGLPARETSSVTIVAPTGILADGFDTGCFILGPERCLARIAELVAHGDMPPIEAVILGADMRLHTTPGTRDHLTLRMPITDDGRILPPGGESGATGAGD